MSMNEKVAYLEGFIEGLDIDQESKEGRAIYAILDVLNEFAEECEEMKEDIEELEEITDELDIDDFSDITELEFKLEIRDEDYIQVSEPTVTVHF